MNTKLTLRMENMLIEQAKEQAARRGKSVSRMFGEFITALGTSQRNKALPPVTSSLLGIMNGHQVSEVDYKNHIRKKYS